MILVSLALQPLLVWSAPQVVTSGDYKVYIDDTPGWVTPPPVSAAPIAASGADPFTLELLDTQVSVRPGQVSSFLRIVTRVTNQAGVEGISQVPIRYIPNFQTLTIHGAWVTRDDKRASRLDPAAIRLVANESDMDKNIYRGIVTAVVFVKDLKPGDLLEISYSISGHNPVLGEHALVAFPLALPVPVKLLHVRLLAPTDHRFESKTFNTTAQPVVRTEGGFTDTTFVLRNVAKYEPEPQAPPESTDAPFAQFSDFRSWEEVGDWARTLFAWQGSLPPQLRARIKEWQAHSDTPQDAARLALDYVQKEIRYVSVSVGESALRPAPPDEVIRRGFGDCKDKSLLLVTLLRSMGIAASPALVSTTWEGAAFDLLPSAEMFDHVIVTTEIDGRKYWLDGTSEFQAGPLAARFAGNYGRALVIGPSGSSVEAIAPSADYSPAYSTSHRFVITRFSEPVDLFIHATYDGVVADVMRARAQADRSAMEKEGLDRYKRLYPSVERVGGLAAHSDDKSGRMDAIVQYRIPEFFDYNKGVLKGAVTATNLWWELGSIDATARKTPLRLRYPHRVTQDIVVEFPEAVPLASAEPISIKDDYVAFAFSKKYEGRKLTLHFEYQTLARSIPPRAIGGHNDVRKRIAKWLAVEFTIPTAPQQASGGQPARPESSSVAQSLLFESEEQERATTADIESGRLTNKQLTQAYLSRAWTREYLARYEDALEDTKRALELDDKDGSALETMAFELKMLRRFDEARQQYGKAEQNLHDSYAVHMGRGQLNYYSGQFGEAQADFRRATAVAKEDDKYDHALLWLFLASARAGADAKAEVQPYLGSVSRSWPGPAVNLFMGNMEVEPLLEAARDADGKTALKNLCEAQFFVGQYYLLKGDVAKANGAFEQAIATDVRQYVEFVYAKWELQRMSAPLSMDSK
jgi:lipoprotein NlpI